jgi:hypothetical protein
MTDIKITPLMLFLLLLLILIVASLFGKGLTEGFETVTAETNVFLSLTDYDKYYKNLTRLSTELYYDVENGNVFNVIFNDINNISTTNTIKRLKLMPRSGNNVISYNPTNNFEDSIKDLITKKSLDKITTSWVITSTAMRSQMNYITWGNLTYIYIMNIEDATNSYIIDKMYCFEGNNNIYKKEFGNKTTLNVVPKEKYVKYVADKDDSASIVEPLYDSKIKVVQFMKNVKFDMRNGNLIINGIGSAPTTAPSATTAAATTAAATTAAATTAAATTAPSVATTAAATTAAATTAAATTAAATTVPAVTTAAAKSKMISVYHRSNSYVGLINTPTKKYYSNATNSTDSSKITNLTNATKPIFVQEPISKHTIMYWPNGKTTVLAAFANYFDDGVLMIKINRFTNASMENEATTPTNSVNYTSGSNNDILDEYLKWSNYMLKTQVVPPVCPACPSCKHGSGNVCTSCGGNGGSGTASGDGKSLAFKDDNSVADVKGPSSAVASVGKSAGSVLEKTVDTTGKVLGGATNLAAGTVGMAGGLVGGTVGTAANLVGGTVGTAANLVGGTIGTTANLLGSAGSGLTNMLKNDSSRVGYTQSYQGAQQNGYNRNNTGIATQNNSYSMGTQAGAPIDTYSYNGALQSKGANFRPLTADFSAFSK